MNDNQLSRFELIESGIFDLYKEERYNLHKQNKDVFNFSNYHYFEKEPLKSNFVECVKMYNSISRRKTRVFKKLIYWFYYISKYTDKMLIFGTLTFRDEVLASTSKATRRKYVARFLNDHTLHYVSNIDYGKKNNREHYHFIALVAAKIKKDSWPYGFDSYTRIKKNTSLRNRKNYLMKLTNHTYKDTTRQERVLSDRKEDKSMVVLICQNRKEFITFKENFYLELLSNNEKSK